MPQVNNNKKISELSSASSILDDDKLVIARGTSNLNVAGSLIKDLVGNLYININTSLPIYETTSSISWAEFKITIGSEVKTIPANTSFDISTATNWVSGSVGIIDSLYFYVNDITNDVKVSNNDTETGYTLAFILYGDGTDIIAFEAKQDLSYLYINYSTPVLWQERNLLNFTETSLTLDAPLNIDVKIRLGAKSGNATTDYVVLNIEDSTGYNFGAGEYKYINGSYGELANNNDYVLNTTDGITISGGVSNTSTNNRCYYYIIGFRLKRS